MKPQRKDIRISFVRCLAVLLLAVACNQLGKSPGKTVQDLSTAIEHRNYDEALSYYSSATRAGFGDDKIRAVIAGEREKRKDPAKDFQVTILQEKVTGDSATVYARVGTAKPENWLLIKEDGKWKISGG